MSKNIWNFTKLDDKCITKNYPEYSQEEIFENWNNFSWKGWHSPTWESLGRPVRDDEYLRNAILSKLPLTKTSISIIEMLENWHNETWWQENYRNVVEILDNMYIKKETDPKKKKHTGGIYSNWLTRCVQFINTYKAEKTLADIANGEFIYNIEAHSTIHTGIASDEDSQPDFITRAGIGVELKLCEDEEHIESSYLKSMRDNSTIFKYKCKYDFHDAQKAIFATKSNPSKLYTVDLSEPENLTLDEYQELDLHLIPTVKGKLTNSADYPAVPKPLLFGLTPKWQK